MTTAEANHQTGETERVRAIGVWGAALFILVYIVATLVAAYRLPPTTDEVLYMGASEGIVQDAAWDSAFMRFQGPVGLYFNRIFAESYREHRKDDRQAYVTSGRLGMLLASTLLAMGIFLWSRRLFGSAGGLVSLALYCLNPLMVGYGAIVPIDMVHAGTTLLALFALWMYALRPSFVRGACFGAAAGLLFATKYLAILLIPFLLLVAFAFGIARTKTADVSLGRRALAVCGHLLAASLSVFIVMHAAYLFSVGFASTDPGVYMSERLQSIAANPASSWILSALPEPYAIGLDERLNAGEPNRKWYAAGTYGDHPDYFLLAIALKMPDLIVLFLTFGSLALALRYRRWRELDVGERTAVTVASITLVPGFVLLSFLVNYKIGVRYAIQFLPPLFVLMGGVAGMLSANLLRLRPAFRYSLLALPILILGGELVRSSPNHIGYYNVLSGGQARAFRYFVDSNSDWAQYKAEGHNRLVETEPPETIFLKGSAGPRFGRIALYVGDLMKRQAMGDRRAWHWIVPFTPAHHFEAAWYVFDISEEEYRAAAADDARVRADLAMAYLLEGRVEAARPLLGACDEHWREPLQALAKALEEPRPPRELIELATRFNTWHAPDLAIKALTSREIDTERFVEATQQHALALTRLARTDEAAKLIESNPKLMERPTGLGLLIGIHVVHDPAAALELLQANPQLKDNTPQLWKNMKQRRRYLQPLATHGMLGGL